MPVSEAIRAWNDAAAPPTDSWCFWCLSKNITDINTRIVSPGYLREVSIAAAPVQENWHQCTPAGTTRCRSCGEGHHSCIRSPAMMAGDIMDCKTAHVFVLNMKWPMLQANLLPALRELWGKLRQAVNEHMSASFTVYDRAHFPKIDELRPYLQRANNRLRPNGLAYLQPGEPGWATWDQAKTNFEATVKREVEAITAQYRATSAEEEPELPTLTLTWHRIARPIHFSPLP